MKPKKEDGARMPSGVSMKNKKTPSVQSGDAVKTRKKPSFLTIFVCIFLAVLIIFGAVFGIINAYKHSNSVAYGEGVYISRGEANYFASIFKVTYMGILNSKQISGVEDTEEFWSRKSESGESFGVLLERGFKSYLSEIIAGNILFDSYSELSGRDESVIEDTIERVVVDRAGGTVESFNKEAEKYGFDYDDFCSAVVLQYKYEMARVAIYGSDGTRLDGSLADEFLKKYTRVSLAFIRTDYERELDERTGEYVYTEMDSVERERRMAEIERFKGYVDNIKLGSGEIMTAATFREIVNDYEGDSTVDFYFYDGSSETEMFAEDFEEVVDKSLELGIGEFGYAECNAEATANYRGFKGYCFIYRTEIAGRPYADEENTFFSDFYELASRYYYATNLAEYMKDAEFTDLYDELTPVLIPKNNRICIMAWEI